MNVISPETRMMGLPYGEEIMIVGRTMWTQCTSVTDGQTDGRTDRRTDIITITKTVQRIASHGKNVFSFFLKVAVKVWSRMSTGRSFHTDGSVNENAL